MNVATKAHFWALKKTSPKVKKIPANGIFGNGIDFICIRTFTEKERGEIATKIYKTNKDGIFSVEQERTFVVMYGVCDQEGNRIFHDDDFSFLENLESGVIAGIYNAIEDHGKVSFVKESDRIEDTAKN